MASFPVVRPFAAVPFGRSVLALEPLVERQVAWALAVHRRASLQLFVDFSNSD